MSVAVESAAAPMDLCALHERMGRVYHQPVRVRSFTNKRFTVNFRVPLEQLRQIVPERIDLDEIPGTGLGMFSMRTCDFWVSRLGWVRIPPVRNNDMLLRISTKIKKGGSVYRTYYTLRSDSSSSFLGFFGKRFSHFRKQVSEFVRVDDGTTYSLENRATNPLCRGKFTAVMASISKDKPATTNFTNMDEAKKFVFDLDGSSGYSYERDMLSYQKIDYPPWDMYFCHEYQYDFPLMDYLNRLRPPARAGLRLVHAKYRADLGYLVALPGLSEQSDSGIDGLNLQHARRIDAVCRSFEADWRAGKQRARSSALTHWTVVLAAGRPSSAGDASAQIELWCVGMWYHWRVVAAATMRRQRVLPIFRSEYRRLWEAADDDD